MFIKKITLSGLRFTESIEFHENFNSLERNSENAWVSEAFQIIFSQQLKRAQVSKIFGGDFSNKSFISIEIDNWAGKITLINKVPEPLYEIIFYPTNEKMLVVNGTPLKRYILHRQMMSLGILLKTQQKNYLNVILSSTQLNDLCNMDTKNWWLLISDIFKYKHFEWLSEQQFMSAYSFDMLERDNAFILDDLSERHQYLEEMVKVSGELQQMRRDVITKTSQINSYYLRKMDSTRTEIQLKINELNNKIEEAEKYIDEKNSLVEMNSDEQCAADVISDLIVTCECSINAVQSDIESVKCHIENIEEFEVLNKEYSECILQAENKLSELHSVTIDKAAPLYEEKLKIEVLHFQKLANILIEMKEESEIEFHVHSLKDLIESKKDKLKQNEDERDNLSKNISAIRYHIKQVDAENYTNKSKASSDFRFLLADIKQKQHATIENFILTNSHPSHMNWNKLYDTILKHNIDIDAMRGIREIDNCVAELTASSIISSEKAVHRTVYNCINDANDKPVSEWLYYNIESIFTLILFRKERIWNLVKEKLSNKFKYNVLCLDNFYAKVHERTRKLSQEIKDNFPEYENFIKQILSHEIRRTTDQKQNLFVLSGGNCEENLSLVELKKEYAECYKILKDNDIHINMYSENTTGPLINDMKNMYLEKNMHFKKPKHYLEYYEMFSDKLKVLRLEQENAILKMEIEKWQVIETEYQSVRENNRLFAIDEVQSFQKLKQELRIIEVKIEATKSENTYKLQTYVKEFYDNLRINDNNIEHLTFEWGILDTDEELQKEIIEYYKDICNILKVSIADLHNSQRNLIFQTYDVDIILNEKIKEKTENMNRLNKQNIKLDYLRKNIRSLLLENKKLMDERIMNNIICDVNTVESADEINQLISDVANLKKKDIIFSLPVNYKNLREIESIITKIGQCLQSYDIYQFNFTNNVLPCIPKISFLRLQFMLKILTTSLKEYLNGDRTTRIICELKDEHQDVIPLTQYIRWSDINNIQIIFDKTKLVQTTTTEVSKNARMLMILSILRATKCPFLIIEDFNQYSYELNDFFQCFGEHLQIIKLSD